MIVKNEENCLERCLKSAQAVVDEIVIVDTGSTDRTIEIAQAYTDQVYQHAWQNDFSAARNAGLEHVSGDWILVLDADEQLEEESKIALRQLVASSIADGLLLSQRNIQPPGSLVSYLDLRITRLFRNRPGYRYTGVIHEQIRPAILAQGGKIEESSLVILHDGYAKKAVQGAELRARRNLDILMHAFLQSPLDAYLAYQIGVTYKALEDMNNAMEWLNKALDLDFKSLGPEILTDLFMKLAQLALGKDEHQQAAVYAQSSLKYDTTNSLSRYVLALSFFYQGEIRQAYQTFCEIRQDPRLDPGSTGDLDQVIRYCQMQLKRPSTHKR
jgi:tetratricopeptide (TPR) repeat protein